MKIDIMGQGKKKKQRFFKEHSNCCFCGGVSKATTIDHVPPRAPFHGRAAPEGFEFPACERCQFSTSKDEIAFSFMVAISA